MCVEILLDVAREGREIVYVLETEAAQENGGNGLSGNIKSPSFFKEIFLDK